MKKNFSSSTPFMVLISLLLSLSLSAVSQEQKHHIELSVSEPFSTLWGFNFMMTTTPRSYEAYESAYGEWVSVSRPYGNVELGYGYKGLLSIGVGTRF